MFLEIKQKISLIFHECLQRSLTLVAVVEGADGAYALWEITPFENDISKWGARDMEAQFGAQLILREADIAANQLLRIGLLAAD
jgi:hypothetical protein